MKRLRSFRWVLFPVVALVVGACGVTPKRKQSDRRRSSAPVTLPIPQSDLPGPVFVIPDDTKLPAFMNSENFFPAEAMRTYDLSEAPTPAGPEKLYASFPSEEPYLSPDKKWQWRFKIRGETEKHKVLSLENHTGEQQMEILLLAPSVRILWSDDGLCSAITSWDERLLLRVDIVAPPHRWTQRVPANRAAFEKFFSDREIDGAWHCKAWAWKTSSVLVVRAFRGGTMPGEKLYGAEFSVNLNGETPAETFRLLRAFVAPAK